ncbi:hypothetical protein GE061_013586 [Apolygus lucorum]|uniref:Uncharacterized protein n=1 Tax=Apolygus lucorum TaxID=248454 RepID=A0A6A4K0R7_APOLU|nr:hypothetical protein GE061_013586 [Apolygus lucorum]
MNSSLSSERKLRVDTLPEDRRGTLDEAQQIELKCSEKTMNSEIKKTEWALLFPLKAGLLSLRSSASLELKPAGPPGSPVIPARLRLRRGSSMTDLGRPPPLSPVHLAPGVGHQPSGSIGDLMNMKRYYGSSGDVTLENIIARTVPLSTVSPRPSRQLDLALDPESPRRSPRPSPKIEALPENPTTQQRAQRLSRLISQQRNSSRRTHHIIG